MQYLSLGKSWQNGCKMLGTVLHELGHAIGFWHEQSRPDRDDYIKIIWENVDPNYAANFDKYSYYEIDSREVTYDYKSIMHYSQYVS